MENVKEEDTNIKELEKYGADDLEEIRKELDTVYDEKKYKDLCKEAIKKYKEENKSIEECVFDRVQQILLLAYDSGKSEGKDYTNIRKPDKLIELLMEYLGYDFDGGHIEVELEIKAAKKQLKRDEDEMKKFCSNYVKSNIRSVLLSYDEWKERIPKDVMDKIMKLRDYISQGLSKLNISESSDIRYIDWHGIDLDDLKLEDIYDYCSCLNDAIDYEKERIKEAQDDIAAGEEPEWDIDYGNEIISDCKSKLEIVDKFYKLPIFEFDYDNLGLDADTLKGTYERHVKEFVEKYCEGYVLDVSDRWNKIFQNALWNDEIGEDEKSLVEQYKMSRREFGLKFMDTKVYRNMSDEEKLKLINIFIKKEKDVTFDLDYLHKLEKDKYCLVFDEDENDDEDENIIDGVVIK